jgi:hypothetical protein
MRWTVQQFSTVAGSAWFALHQYKDGRLLCTWTGTRAEIDAVWDRLGTRHRAPLEDLPAIEEEEYYRRFAEEEQW